MARETLWEDEYTLLCERCGYVVEGLDTEGNCPECGKPIAESLPERRVGTPWQQGASIRSLLATWRMTLRSPRATLDRIRFDSDYDSGLAQASSAIWLIGAPVALLLTWIESRGLQFFGDRHKYRIDQRIGWAVCAHGSVGWVVSALSLALGTFLVWRGIEFSIHDYYFPEDGDPSKRKPWITGILMWGGGSIGTIGFLAGFLFLETFAWLGLRRCKFANRVRPTRSDEEPVADARGSLPRASESDGKEPGA